MKLVGRLFFAAIVIVVVWTGWRFATVNSAPTDIHFVFGQWHDVPLWRVIVFATVIGGAIVGLLMGYLLLRAQLIARRYRRLCKGLEEEVHQLRNLPLVDSGEPESRADRATLHRAATRPVAAGGG